MTTNPTNTRLTALTRVLGWLPMVTSFLRLFLVPFVAGSERPTEAKEGSGCPLNHEDKMKVLAALDMLETKLTGLGQALTARELEIFETALRVIGPID